MSRYVAICRSSECACPECRVNFRESCTRGIFVSTQVRALEAGTIRILFALGLAVCLSQPTDEAELLSIFMLKQKKCPVTFLKESLQYTTIHYDPQDFRCCISHVLYMMMLDSQCPRSTHDSPLPNAPAPSTHASAPRLPTKSPPNTQRPPTHVTMIV